MCPMPLKQRASRLRNSPGNTDIKKSSQRSFSLNSFFVNFTSIMVSIDPRQLQKLSKLSDSKISKIRQKVLVFSFFLLVSVIIWLLNALAKNYTTDIRYPITYTDFPEEKVLIGTPPENLVLRVNAHGYALLRYKMLNRPVPINFQVSSYAMSRVMRDTSTLFILTRYARDRIARQLPGELQLLDINPDSLLFRFANEERKVVPVKPRIDFELGSQFTTVEGIGLSPDSLEITGPDIFLDTLKQIYTRRTDLGFLEKSYRGKIPLQRISGLKYDQEKVSCTIEIEKITEIELYVPIGIEGLPDSLRMQTFPPRIKVSGNVGLSHYERIVPEAFRAVVHYEDVAENRKRIPVSLPQFPESLSNPDFYPKTVEYLLSEK
mgnify:CR=1 FL=1